MIYIIDDDRLMSECLERYLRPEEVKIFGNAIDAISNIDEDNPKLIFLDVLLDGPDAFTFLNEIVSYENTAKIPVVIVTSLNLDEKSMQAYGVKKVLKKETLTPEEVKKCLALI
ncbi:MAG: response regulator [Candidatus Saccharibacteria bacterium]|nr:response regulator [Candidatus Saccharibacteria bacterium]